MKKLFTTLLLSVTAVVCAFAVTACNNGNEQGSGTEDETKTTVTESEWTTAFTYFKVDSENGGPSKSDYPRVNFVCTSTQEYSYGEEAGSYGLSLSLDFDKKAAALEFESDGYYAWKDGETCYGIGDGWESDRETGETKEFYTKDIMSEEALLEGLDAQIFSYAGGMYVSGLGLADKFSEFTYSEDDGTYAATISSDEYEGSYDITVSFTGGKLSKLVLGINSEEGRDTTTYEYTYGTSVTIPEYFLNLPVGKTEKPKAN